MNDQEASSSSELSLNEEINKSGDGEQVKKLSESNEESEGQIEAQKLAIYDLPAEMLMEILKNVDTKSLIPCQLVNRNWNLIASELLQSRTDLQIQVEYQKSRGMSSGDFNEMMMPRGTLEIKGETKEKSLINFMKYFESQNRIYSRFCLLGVDYSLFWNKDWIEFISNFGQRVKGLKLVFKTDGCIQVLNPLLVNQVPNLEELCFDASNVQGDYPAKRLLPRSTQLPRLKSLQLSSTILSKCTGIVADILRASINLEKLHLIPKGRYLFAKDFELIHSLGKIHCLDADAAEIYFDSSFSHMIQRNLHDSLNLKLNQLTLYFDSSCYEINKADALTFVSNLFESSKNTLTKLSIQILGFCNDLCLPVFSKLTSLCITPKYNWLVQEPFRRGLRFDIFPVLKSLELDICWNEAFPSGQNISVIPTLESLLLAGEQGNRKIPIDEISVTCPNLKNFQISGGRQRSLKNFPEVGKEIWTHMKKLQSLELSIFVDTPANAFPAIDSCITGISPKNCLRLHESSPNDKSIILTKGNTFVKIPESQIPPVERENLSLLDLKELRNFKLSLFCYAGYSSTLINTAITCLSKEYAFDLMENFDFEIERN